MRRPSDAALGALAVALCLPPVAHLAGLPGVGSFAMFSDLGEYRIRIAIESDGAWRSVPVRRLARHMGRDARRVILPASRWRRGETSVELLAGALPEIGELVCRLHGGATRAEVLLERRSAREGPVRRRERVQCAR